MKQVITFTRKGSMYKPHCSSHLLKMCNSSMPDFHRDCIPCCAQQRQISTCSEHLLTFIGSGPFLECTCAALLAAHRQLGRPG